MAILWAVASQAAELDDYGAIAGRVADRNTGAPLPSASVHLRTADQSIVSDSNGAFILNRVPAGPHVLAVDYIGYKSLIRDDVIVTTGDTVNLHLSLQPLPVRSTDITVLSDWPREHDQLPGSVARLTAEEMRVSARAFEDVARAVATLPAVTSFSNISNAMIVRGGNPIENGFYIDNIEVPNISHLTSHGSTGGPLSLVNMDLVGDVRFLAGGYGPSYGNRLSSIMDISLRPVRREALHGRASFSGTGLVVSAEGPLWGQSGFQFSYRKSFLDQILDDAEEPIPSVEDFLAKTSIKLSPSHAVTVLGLAGTGELTVSRRRSDDLYGNFYGRWNLTSNAIGADWRANWNEALSSRTSLAYTRQRYDYHYFATATNRDFMRNNTRNATVAFRNVNVWHAGGRHRIDFGVESKRLFDDHDYRFDVDVTPAGFGIPPREYAQEIHTNKIALFAADEIGLTGRLKTTAGMRFDYFSYTRRTHLAPRLGVVYQLAPQTNFHAAGGLYHQHIPLNIMSQNPNHKNLNDPRAYHAVAGLRHNLSDATQTAVEFYYKWYDHLPLDPAQPALYILDEVLDLDGYYFQYHPQLTDVGVAFARGVELTVTRKAHQGLHGMLGLSLSDARYKDLNGVWRDRIIDTEYSVSVDGGYGFGSGWSMTWNWDLQGGRPYTPYDYDLSWRYSHGIYDLDRVNMLRLAPYHSLGARVDYRFDWRGMTTGIYLAAWNIYDRDNLNGYFWNERHNNTAFSYQLGRFVYLGVEIEL